MINPMSISPIPMTHSIRIRTFLLLYISNHDCTNNPPLQYFDDFDPADFDEYEQLDEYEQQDAALQAELQADAAGND
jgi:hypothetical protein